MFCGIFPVGSFDVAELLKLAVSGGGTGGHVIPALNISNAIKTLKPEIEIIYVGAKGSLEERLAAEAGYPFKRVRTIYLRRRISLKNLLVPFISMFSILHVVRWLVANKIRLVIGTGGYSAFPLTSAARLIGKSYVIQEQNAYPGLVTRLLAGGAKRIYLGYEAAAQHLKAAPERILHTGNPVSFDNGVANQKDARRQFGVDEDRFTVFVTGGSGGAGSINKAVDGARESLINHGYNIIWQVGKQWNGELTVPDEFRNRFVIRRFLDKRSMSLAYSASDLVVARCGAMTLAELAQAGLPAVLIPYPYATGGHQEANGRAVESVGGAVVILDNELKADILTKTINNLMETERFSIMADAMRSLARPDAVTRIAEDILSLVE